MILIVVLDDKGGMLFNKRRQSQDELLRMRIIELSKDSKLLMNAYSAKQFANNKIPNLQVTPDPLEEAQAGQYCFVENIKVDNCEPQLEKIVQMEPPLSRRFILQHSSGRTWLELR